MIIDAHSHIWEAKLMSPDMEKIISDVIERFHVSDPEQLRNGTIDRLIGEMDEAGIDKTVLLALDAGIAFRAGATMREYNDYVAAIVKAHPDRIVGFCGIDPRRGKEALGELERCAGMGLRGLKLWTLTGFYPDDESYYPLYERTIELGFPMLFHTGSGPPRTYLKFNRPVYVDKVAVDFPEATHHHGAYRPAVGRGGRGGGDQEPERVRGHLGLGADLQGGAVRSLPGPRTDQGRHR